jgi:tetratricopeptide (TPR) repeat protein
MEKTDDAPPIRPPRDLWNSPWAPPLVVAVCAFLAFLPTLTNGFVNWDDDYNFLANPHYRGLGPTQLRWMWTSLLGAVYIPLTWMSLGADHLLWGLDPRGYHLTSLLLHALNAALACRLFDRLLESAAPDRDVRFRRAAAFLAALLYAVHPLRTESIAWATERRDVLSTAFYLLAVLTYRPADASSGGAVRRGASWLCFAGGMLSKPSGMTLPFALLLLDVYPFRRAESVARLFRRDALPLWKEKLPYLLIAAPLAALAAYAQAQSGAAQPLDVYGPGRRVSQALFAAVFYVRKTVWPSGLAPLYEIAPETGPFAPVFIVSAALAAAITVAAVRARRSAPAFSHGWAQYLLLLAPVAGLFQAGPQIAADRYSYLPLLALGAVVAGAALRAQEALAARSSAAGALRRILISGVAAAAVLAALSARQSTFWRDSESLWQRVLEVNPRSTFALNNLGNVMNQQGRPAEAAAAFEAALRINPRFAQARNNLGTALFQSGRTEEALRQFEESLRLQPDAPSVLRNIGLALERLGRTAEAEAHLARSLAGDPDDPLARRALGGLLLRRGLLLESIPHFQRALEVRPDYAEAWEGLGDAALRQGRWSEAAAFYRRSLTIKPGAAEALNNLGTALFRAGDAEGAGRHFRAAVAARPDHAEARHNLGILSLQTGRLDEAVEHLGRAVEVRPDFAAARHAFAVALDRAGRRDEALLQMRKAAELDPRHRADLRAMTRRTR